ncbi:MAG TPA: N-acetylmuramoyl-L-alanine amidase [Longimicrobiaceae bacterium]|nr:N-acetylmuramoyl-L-alanine amidase [Longimicrobiaceae bacterium]
MRRIRSLVMAAAAVTLLAACQDEPTSPRAADPPAAPSPGQLDALFARAGEDFHVPASLLKAIGYVETRWQMVRGEQEFEGMPVAHGLMALKGDQLDRGATLAGVSVEAARTQPEANIRAAAALLGAYAEELKLNRADLGAWAPAVARYSRIQSPEGQASYVHQDVYAALREGVVGRSAGGGVLASLMPTRVTADFPQPSASLTTMSTDYAPAIWRPSPNYNARPTGDIGKVAMVIIHTCEGSYTSCWSWLTNSSAQASAHYVVNESGSEISQLVREADRAWHIAATYDCSLNSSVDCWRNGYSSNHFTVGIEHGGYASQTSFPTGQIDASAKLSCHLSQRYGIPRDKYHYVAHGQLQPYNRTDPGPNWPWTDYLNRINSHCGSTSIIVDSNNANNNSATGRFESSANWISTASSPGYYGSGYYYASTQAVSDPATFWFYLPAAATKTIDAWWTAGTNRSTTAPFVAYNASGSEVGRVSVNQQVNGGKWNALGTWSFSAGWNKVVLSRWTTSGYVVIADAIRVR